MFSMSNSPRQRETKLRVIGSAHRRQSLKRESSISRRGVYSPPHPLTRCDLSTSATGTWHQQNKRWRQVHEDHQTTEMWRRKAPMTEESDCKLTNADDSPLQTCCNHELQTSSSSQLLEPGWSRSTSTVTAARHN